MKSVNESESAVAATGQTKDRETAGSVRSFNDVLGLNLIHHQDGEATFELTVSPEHCNLHGSVHGGVILSILDVCGIYAGASPGGGTPQSVTTSVNCSFLRSAGKDDRRIRATGTISKRGKAVYFSSMVVRGEPSGNVIATGQGVYSILQPRSPPPIVE